MVASVHLGSFLGKAKKLKTKYQYSRVELAKIYCIFEAIIRKEAKRSFLLEVL